MDADAMLCFSLKEHYSCILISIVQKSTKFYVWDCLSICKFNTIWVVHFRNSLYPKTDILQETKGTFYNSKDPDNVSIFIFNFYIISSQFHTKLLLKSYSFSLFGHKDSWIISIMSFGKMFQNWLSIFHIVQ